MKPYSLYIILSFLLPLATISCSGDETLPDNNIIGLGDYLPDFTAVMNDGSTVTGDMLRNGISCIVFFNTSCPDCTITLPHIQQAYDEYTLKGVKFALISRAEEDSSISLYWETNGYTMPYSPQKGREIFGLFALATIPRVYISDKNGKVMAIYTDSPLPTYSQIARKLDSLL